MTLPPGTNKYLDLIQNRQPIVSAQGINLVSAIIAAYLDKNVLHFTDPAVDPSGLLTALVVYVIVGFVTAAWAWGKVWSERSHIAAVTDAYTEGQIAEASQHAGATVPPAG